MAAPSTVTISHQPSAIHARLYADGFGGVAGEAQLLADFLVDRVEDRRVVLEELLGVLAALAEALAAVGKPGAALFDDALVDAEVEKIAGLGDAFAVHHVELSLAEGRGDLVFDHLHSSAAADDGIAVLDAGD